MSGSSWLLSLYSFPSSLRLSDNAIVDRVLADIPIISVGLLGFAAFTTFLALKKLNWALVLLFASVSLGLFAAILDLAQGLTRGRMFRQGLDADSIVPLIIAREVLFAVSASVRSLFFWVYVSHPPQGEPPPLPARENQRRNSLLLGSNTQSTHSGTWARWGIFGSTLKWVLFAASVAAGVLQILWRVVQTFHKIGAVYEVEATMQIVVPALFIIKLILNTMIASTPSRWKSLSHYFVMIFALLISMGVGVGNVVYFAFSESSAGRFLVAVAEYLIIVFLLITIFRPPAPTPPPENDRKRVSSFQGLRIRSHESALAAMGPQANGGLTVQVDRPSGSSRSSAARLSAWIGSRAHSLAGRPRPALERDEVRLWNQEDAERGLSPSMSERRMTGVSDVPSPFTEEAKQSARWQDPAYMAVMAESPWSADKRSVTPTTARQAVFSSVEVEQDRTVIKPDEVVIRPPSTAPSAIPSYYVREITPPSPLNLTAQLPTRQVVTPSPIYGLTGTIRGDRYSPVVDSRPYGELDIASARSSGFENLLREQNELEKSIAALKLFAPDAGDRDSQTTSSGDRNSNRNSTAVRGSRLGLESASMKSEFSLSNFPQPPKSRHSTDGRRKGSDSGSSLGTERGSGAFSLVLPRMPAAIEESEMRQSLPKSTRNSEDTTVPVTRPSRLDSGGTQYDVTSFIGGLTTGPGHRRDNSQLSPVRASPVESEPESANSATIVTVSRQISNAQVAQKMIFPRSGSVPPSDTPVFTTSATPPSDTRQPIADVPDSPVMGTSDEPLNRVLSPSPTSQYPLAPPTYTRAPGTRTGPGARVGLPPRPRQRTISSPRTQGQSMDDTAFERPRPAPLVIRPLVKTGRLNIDTIGGAL